MEAKIAIVCNSIKPDLVEYFKCKIKSIEKTKSEYMVLKNNKIKLLSNKNVYNSSYMHSSFMDIRIIIDLLMSCYIVLKSPIRNVKIVHFTTAHVSNIFLSVILKLFRVKQVFTLHDLTPHPGKKEFFISIYNKLIIKLLSDEIIVFSENEIKKIKDVKKYKCVKLSGYHQEICKSKVGNKTILFFGRIEPYKGLSNLLNIIKIMNDINSDYQFVIAGSGKIDKLSEFEKYKNVKIINRFIEQNEINDIFENATYTILPYDSATQSGVVILSYSYATPVIAYDVGSLSEYIENGKNGFIVKYKDDDKICTILKSLSNEKIRYMSGECIKIFEKNYSNYVCEKLYYSYYMSLLRNC